MAQVIHRSVGIGGVNVPEDVRVIQSLLNLIPAELGGPSEQLAVDGIIGPLTIAAISQFQRFQLGFADGLVEPDSQVLALLNELATGSGGLFEPLEIDEEPATDTNPF